MEEMNHAIAIILSDIDILLLKSEDNKQNNVPSIITSHQTPFDVLENDLESDVETNIIINPEENEIDLRPEYSGEHMALDVSNEYNIYNNAMLRNYTHSTVKSEIEGDFAYMLDYETGTNSSLRVFVRKFDEIAQNINRILSNLCEKR